MKLFVIYGLTACVALLLVWASWAITIKTMPPIKVTIVEGCK